MNERYIRRAGLRERLYYKLAVWFDMKACELAERAWERHEREWERRVDEFTLTEK